MSFETRITQLMEPEEVKDTLRRMGDGRVGSEAFPVQGVEVVIDRRRYRRRSLTEVKVLSRRLESILVRCFGVLQVEEFTLHGITERGQR